MNPTSTPLTIPPSFIGNVFQTVSTTLGNFKGVIVLLIGVLVFFWVAGEAMSWISDRIEAREDFETKVAKLERSYKIVADSARGERFEAMMREPSARRAVEQRERFKKTMAGEGVDVNA